MNAAEQEASDRAALRRGLSFALPMALLFFWVPLGFLVVWLVTR